jgi:SAM-dependent methyltransferase
MHSDASGLFLGFDEHGEVRDLGHVVHRKIRDDYKSQVAQLYATYRDRNLAAKGIVETAMREDGDLEHRKLVTSYPYEWPANMYKDAVLFHLGLFLELDQAGLTLKDALPNNIVFDHTSPVFVDFLSLVPIGKLKEADWLYAEDYADARFAVVGRMLMPYMILPVLFQARGEYRIARDLLSWRSCNCDGKPPSWLELLRPNQRPGFGWPRDYLHSLGAAARLLPSRIGNRRKNAESFLPLIRGLTQQVRAMDVTPRRSAYSSYYDEKKEALSLREPPSTFPPKQLAVHEVLRARAPGTVLDIGANTGWYSMLAANLGASVIALEGDESCIDILYGQARAQGLRILPLKLAFGDLTTEIHGSRATVPHYDYSQSGPQALYRAGADRLGADLLLVLGLLHHLVLGEGRSFDAVFETLRRLARKTLVLEFVALDDDKIRDEPGFFPRLKQFDASNYNLDLAVQAGRRHFARVEVRPSHPATRTILVFDK